MEGCAAAEDSIVSNHSEAERTHNMSDRFWIAHARCRLCCLRCQMQVS